MKAVLFATLAGTAAAFAPQSASRTSTAVKGAMEDLQAVAVKCNPVIKVRAKESIIRNRPCYDNLDDVFYARSMWLFDVHSPGTHSLGCLT
jgi:hypothetical protein